MNNYPNGPQHPTQETGPGYEGGYQPQQQYPQTPQMPIQGPEQFQGPSYPQQQPQMPGYPPQSQMGAFPQQGYPQQGYPQQQMQMPYQQPMRPQMMMPQMNINVNVNQRPEQINMLIRMIYFLFVGWWLGFMWLGIALVFMATVIGLPIGLLMINRTGAVMTLSRR